MSAFGQKQLLDSAPFRRWIGKPKESGGDRHTDLEVSIPMVDGAKSLNVAAAAAICPYDGARRRRE
jgi:tRNA(Leu) C34 or U34 (ribose-2'-O)-methylase TrmL